MDEVLDTRVDVVVEVFPRVDVLLRLVVLLRSTVAAVRCLVSGVMVLMVVRVVPLWLTRVSTDVEGSTTLVVVEIVRSVPLTGVVCLLTDTVDCVVVCVGRVEAGRVEAEGGVVGRVVVDDVDLLSSEVPCATRDWVLLRNSPALRIEVLVA